MVQVGRILWKSPDSCVSARVDMVLKKSHEKFKVLTKLETHEKVCIFLQKNTHLYDNVRNSSFKSTVDLKFEFLTVPSSEFFWSKKILRIGIFECQYLHDELGLSRLLDNSVKCVTVMTDLSQHSLN